MNLIIQWQPMPNEMLKKIKAPNVSFDEVDKCWFSEFSDVQWVMSPFKEPPQDGIKFKHGNHLHYIRDSIIKRWRIER